VDERTFPEELSTEDLLLYMKMWELSGFVVDVGEYDVLVGERHAFSAGYKGLYMNVLATYELQGSTWKKAEENPSFPVALG
jgi:hypothetical protein